MAFDLKNPYAQAYINVGRKFGASPAFISASLGNSWDESRWDSANRSGDQGAAYGGMQWNSKYSPDRVAGLMNTAKELNKPWTDPEVQATWWYKENQGNLGVKDINQANDAVVNSLRPAGWKKDNPTGAMNYSSRKNNSLELFNMLSKGQDPRSFMALGSDSMPAANPEQPQGAQNAGTGVPQSISLGSEEQQPFSNIGSTLANMGASIASLDNRGTGIASLNASRVASNLQQQEALRERENGWKYAGQTDNGQGLIFQNSKGETRIEPIAPQFAGKPDSSLPASVREYNERQKNPGYADYMDNKDKLEPSLSEDTRRMYAMRAIKGDNTWTKEIGGDKQGSVDKRAIDEEITTVAKDLKLDANDLMKARTEQRYRNKVADRIALIDVNTETASNKIEAAATNLIETSKKYPRGDIRFLEGLKQKWGEQTNDPNLQSLKTAVDAFALDYATALNPQKTSPTVDDVRNARNKILTTMNQESLEAAVGIVQREIGSIRQNARRTHEQWFGSSEEPAAAGGKKTIRDSEGSKPTRLKYNPTTGELE